MNADLVGTVLWPCKWVVEAILVACHGLLSAVGFPGTAGSTWVLAVLGLVIVVRVALTPLFVRQVRSRRMAARIAPELRRIQARYRGKNDRLSREAMSRETMDLHRRSGTSPFASCLPAVVQAPILLSLFQVLDATMRSPGRPGVGFLTAALSSSFGHASLFGAPLQLTLLTPGAPPAVLVIGLVMIAVMAASQLVAQLVTTGAGAHLGATSRPVQGRASVLLALLPVVFVASAIAFPLGVMSYWTFSNVWTLAQTLLVGRPFSPPPERARPTER